MLENLVGQTALVGLEFEVFLPGIVVLVGHQDWIETLHQEVWIELEGLHMDWLD